MYHEIVQGFSDWADPYSLPGAPRAAERPSTASLGMLPTIASEQAWDKYNRSQAAQKAWAKNIGQIESARLTAAPALIKAPAEAEAIRRDAVSLGGLRLAQGQSQVLRARTKNLETTAAVSQQVQEPVKAEVTRALPWVIGGAVVLGLVGIILYRTKKK